MNATIITRSAEETEKFGEQLARQLKPGDVLLLYGNLGAGKTTLTKGIAKGLGIMTRIMSPTFTLVRQHEIDLPSINTLYHIDLYRLENIEQIKNIGFDEIIHDSEGITIIEWPEKLGDQLPERRIQISVKNTGEDTREIVVKDNARDII